MVVYADNASTTKTSTKVLNSMFPYLSEWYGNPSSLHTLGRKARSSVEDARERIAKCIGAKDKDEIIFTSGGSESNNLAMNIIKRIVLLVSVFATFAVKADYSKNSKIEKIVQGIIDAAETKHRLEDLK